MRVRSVHRSPLCKTGRLVWDFQTPTATASLLQIGGSKEVENHTLVGLFRGFDECYLLGTVN